jgi:hypothetical protein
VYLQWYDRSTNETGFEVQRELGLLPPDGPDSNWIVVGQTDPNVTTFNEYAPVASTYQYRVRAMRNSIGSAPSNVVVVSTPLYQPYLPNVTANDSASIKVKWQLNAFNSSKFPDSSYITEIYRALGANPGPNDWTLVKTTAGGEINYLDSGLQPDSTYSYKMRFKVQDSGQSIYSLYTEVVYTKTMQVQAPPPPNNLKAEAVSTSQVNISWDDVANETGYVLERQLGLTGRWQTVSAGISADTTSFADSGLIAGQFHQYRIRASNGSSFSAYSNIASATVKPTGVN